MLEQLSIIFQSSSKITVDRKLRRKKLSPFKYGPIAGRCLYFIMALLNTREIICMKRDTLSHFRYLIETHPETIPSIFWPYQCKSWDTSTRINYLYNHFATLPELKHAIDYKATHQSVLADGREIYPTLQIVVDKHDFYVREGMITLNLFVAHQRVFTIAFSFYKNKKEQICAIVGALQGKRMPDIIDLYRDMTKKTYGIRPRDLMIEVFQMLCRLSSVKKIYAVSESHRQHRHSFYCLKNKLSKPSINYDEVWTERNGVRRNDAFFELPLIPCRKPISQIVSKKRSMYRNRYVLLKRLEHKIEQGLSTLESRKVDANPICWSTLQ
ncbi:MAG: DUF535 family protein [Candidatus Thiodiazotropha sp.]